MKLGKLIEKAIRLRGQQFDTDIMTDWINEIEGQAVEMVIGRAKGYDAEFVPYVYELDAETELRIPDRFQDVYLNYIFSKIDFNNQETERYNNDVAMFTSAWEEYGSWFIRNHEQKPLPCFKNL